jgi:hypothetical protein
MGTIRDDRPRWSGNLRASVPRTSPFSYQGAGDLEVWDGDLEFGVTWMAMSVSARDEGFYCWEAIAVVATGEVGLGTPGGLAYCERAGH